MAKSNNMKDLLKQRMSAAQQVSEMEISNRAYESLIDPLPAAVSTIRELPVDKLRPFFTTDIGFHPYPPEKLRAFAQQLLEQGLLERIIVRSIPGSDEYEIRKAVKLAGLIPPLADVLENNPRNLPLSCADMIADYDAASQEAFVEMCRIEGYRLNKATLNHITQKCPPPTADKQAIYAAWREARAAADKKHSAPSKKITFDRRKFAPYLEQIGSEAELEEMFLKFLKETAHKRATRSR